MYVLDKSSVQGEVTLEICAIGPIVVRLGRTIYKSNSAWIYPDGNFLNER